MLPLFTLDPILQQIFRRSSSKLSSTTAATREAVNSTQRPAFVRYPYFLPRNSRGSLPVYTDIRNAGTRHQVLIRNVQGDVNALGKDLLQTLFKNGPESHRMQIQVIRSKHLIITGGRWKNDVVEWLAKRGF